MDWGIVWRKTSRGTLAAAALGGLGVLVLSVQELQTNPKAPAVVAMLTPLALHYLGVLQNMVKHWKKPKIAPVPRP